jgi:hypothetical protein
MSKTLEEIEKDVQELTEEEKLMLLNHLHESLREPVDPEIERKTLEEIKRRIKRAEDDPSLWLDGDTAMAEIEAKLHVKI